MNYIDCIPDDILYYHIFIYLEKEDILNLLVLISDREVIFENHIRRMYPYLSLKKSWYDQTWCQFLKDILCASVIPIYKSGQLVDQLLIYFNKDNINVKYIINPKDLYPYKGLVYAIFYYQEDFAFVPMPNFIISIMVYISNDNIKIKFLHDIKSKYMKVSECVILNFNDLGNMCIFEQYYDYMMWDKPITNNKIISQTDIVNQLYYKMEGLSIYAFFYKNSKILDYCNVWINSSSTIRGIIRSNAIKKRHIILLFNLLFKKSGEIIKDKTSKELFNLIFDKLKSEGYYHNFDRYITL